MFGLGNKAKALYGGEVNRLPNVITMAIIWCDFSTFIIRDRGRVFSKSRFVFSRVVLSASLQYLLDGLPVVFSAS
jgi:hypothetical protein